MNEPRVDIDFTPICPYCGEPVCGSFLRYGSELLHPECHKQLGLELADVEGEPVETGDN